MSNANRILCKAAALLTRSPQSTGRAAAGRQAAHFRQIAETGHGLAHVGDGINDAPALAAAKDGIAVGGATDVALETADGTVLYGNIIDMAGNWETNGKNPLARLLG